MLNGISDYSPKYTYCLGQIVFEQSILPLEGVPYKLSENCPLGRTDLEFRFYRYYQWYEIAFETVEQFVQRLRVWWVNTLEYYNKIWDAIKGTGADWDYLSTDTDTVTTFNRFLDTPSKDIDFDSKKASSINNSKATREGRRGKTAAEMFGIYRRELINPVTSFLEEFRDLFMKIY